MCRTWYYDFAVMEPLFCVDVVVMLKNNVGKCWCCELDNVELCAEHLLWFFFFNLASWVLCRNFGVWPIFRKMFVRIKHRNWFSVKRIPTQPNTWIHFPFRKIAFPENEIFSGNAFTRNKRSQTQSKPFFFLLSWQRKQLYLGDYEAPLRPCSMRNDSHLCAY